MKHKKAIAVSLAAVAGAAVSAESVMRQGKKNP